MRNAPPQFVTLSQLDGLGQGYSEPNTPLSMRDLIDNIVVAGNRDGSRTQSAAGRQRVTLDEAPPARKPNYFDRFDDNSARGVAPSTRAPSDGRGNYFDRFDEPPMESNAGLFDDLIPRGTSAASTNGGALTPASGPGGLFDDLIPQKAAPSVGRDVAASIAAEGAKGAIALPGIVGDVANLPGNVMSWLAAHGAEKLGLLPQGKTANDLLRDMNAVDAVPLAEPNTAGQALIRGASNLGLPTSSGMIRGAEAIIGPFHEPETPAGRFAGSIAGMVPAVAAGPGSVGRKAATAIMAGTGSELAGEAAQRMAPGTIAEPFARIAGGVFGGGLASLRLPPSRALERGLEGVTKADIDAAERLILNAASGPNPVRVSWDEAIARVTGGRGNLTSTRRVVENSEYGAPLKEMMAERPGQIEAAGRGAFNRLAPVNDAPSSIGPAVGEAAKGTITDVQGAINTATRPLYQAAEQQRVGPQIHSALMGDPLYAKTLGEVRGDPALNATIANLPDDSVGVIDLVQRRLREKADAAAMPGQADSSNLKAANYGGSRQAPIEAAEKATGSDKATGAVGSYERARQIQADLREKYLAPLMNGPLGKLQNEPATEAAIEALFPAKPSANSEKEITTAVQALAKRRPEAARDLIRAHAESVFNEATQANIPGENAWGGGKFAAVLTGNKQQAKNLEAAIKAAYSDGAERWQGFRGFLDTMEATGKAPRAGSNTAPDTGTRKLLSEGGILNALSGPARAAQDFADKIRMGSNMSQVASILTDPKQAGLLRSLANETPGSSKAMAIVARVIMRAEAAHNARERRD